ncbi:MAG: F0F1 ATP synthase subunit epsilon [Pseudomonadota bacterium]
MAKILLEVVTPEKIVASEEVDVVVANGYEGEFAILPSHTPFLTSLQPGGLWYRHDGKVEWLAVAGGFVEVSNNKMTILAESAERAHEIDVERARKARERAEQRLRAKEKMDSARAQGALQRAVARLRIAERRG